MLGKEADHFEIFFCHFRLSVQDNSADLPVLKTQYLIMKGTRKEPFPQKSSLTEIKSCMSMDTTWSPMKEFEDSVSSKLYMSRFPTSSETHCISTTTTNWLMLPREIMFIVRII